MITAIDSNVLVGLWNPDDRLNTIARVALDSAYARGHLLICGAVYSELLAGPTRTPEFIDVFLEDAEITVDWSSNETVWRTAGIAYGSYAALRRRRRTGEPRRILTDFYIGAHALAGGHRLLTLDDAIYRKAFPELNIVKT